MAGGHRGQTTWLGAAGALSLSTTPGSWGGAGKNTNDALTGAAVVMAGLEMKGGPEDLKEEDHRVMCRGKKSVLIHPEGS